MADLITRLKLESGEYDSKIKRAGQELLAYGERCKKIGLQMGYANQDAKDFAKALGSMQTVSTSARGKINELSEAFVNLKVMYKNMTNEEKNNEFGKNLAASLDKLKTRINDSKKELNDINAEIGNSKQTSSVTGQALEELAGKFGLNVGQLTKFGGALAVAGTALKVAKDAFFQTEGNIDEWGRTVKGAEGAYDVFLQTLNNGNWSNFFKNLSTAVQGARDLYDSLDRLGSIKSNNQAAIAIVQQQIAQLRLLKQQGKNVDDQLKEATQRLAQLQGQAVSAGKTAGKKTIQQTIRNGVNSMGGAAVSDKSIQAAVGGILTKGQAEFDKYAGTVKRFENYSKAQRTVTRSDMDGNRWTERVFDINLLNKQQQRQYKLAKAIKDRETEIQKGIALYAQSVQEGTANAREEFKGNRYALQGSRGGGKGGSKQSPAEKAQEKYAQAQQDYNQAIEQAALEVKAGMIGESDANKKKLSATETLWRSIGDAREIYDSQALKDAQKKVETEMISLGKAVKEANTEWVTGPSGFNQKTISTYQSMLQESMKGMDYGSTDFTETFANSIDVTTLSNLLKKTLDRGLDITKMQFENGSPVMESLWEKIFNGENIDDKVWEDLGNIVSKQLKAKGGKGIKINTATGDVEEVKEQDYLQQMQKLNSGLSSVNSGLQQIGIKLPDGMQKMLTVMQGVTSVIQGVQTVISVFSTSTQSANTAAVMANTGTMTALIAALTANTAALSVNTTANFIPFATGGIVHAAGGTLVPGNSFSGDRVPALLNSGELVLSRSQQFNLASQLEGENNQGGGTPMLPYVSGDKIILGANNFLKGAGKGELVTTSYLRQKGLI